MEEERAKTFELTTRRGDGQKKHSPKCGFSNCGLTQLVPGKHEGIERKLKKRALFRQKFIQSGRKKISKTNPFYPNVKIMIKQIIVVIRTGSIACESYK